MGERKGWATSSISSVANPKLIVVEAGDPLRRHISRGGGTPILGVEVAQLMELAWRVARVVAAKPGLVCNIGRSEILFLELKWRSRHNGR